MQQYSKKKKKIRIQLHESIFKIFQISFNSSFIRLYVYESNAQLRVINSHTAREDSCDLF